LKYGGWEVSRRSLVFCFSKGNGAYDRPLLRPHPQTRKLLQRSKIFNIKRHADIGKKLDGYKSLFNEYAESTGFEEDSKVVIKRGEHEVTISETASMGISEDALNLIEGDKKFKKYSSCLETVKVVNSELLMADLEKDLADGKITKEEAELLISTKKGTRITAK
jgi:hypothetical protein